MSDSIAPPDEALFPTCVQGIGRIGLVCGNMNDRESISETAPFTGMNWMHVELDLWAKRYNAISFFSAYAFYYFTPSVIRCFNISQPDTLLALVGMVQSIISIDALDEIAERNQRRWMQFSGPQLLYISTWFEDISRWGDCGFDPGELLACAEMLGEYAKSVERIEGMIRF